MVSLKQLHQSSFTSLTQAGFDWYSFIKKNPRLEKQYFDYLDAKSKYIIVNADYSQLECYVLASLSGDQKFIDVVNSGKDVHSSNVTSVYGLDKDTLEAELRLAEEANNLSAIHEYKKALEDFKTKRRFIKALTFALSYGAGESLISGNLRISIQEAKKLIDDFYNAYPRIKEWQRETVEFAIKNGYIETKFGRQRATPRLHNNLDAYNAFVLEKKATIERLKQQGNFWNLREEVKVCLNTPIQSLASDMASKAFCVARRKFIKEKRDCRMLFWVHDSAVMSCALKESVENIRDLMKVMEDDVKYPGDPVNYRTASDIGYNYEYYAELDRGEILSDKFNLDFIKEKLAESLDKDINKKFKLIVKSTSGDLMNAEGYIDEVKEAKLHFFEKMLSEMGHEGYTPMSWMAYMNGMTADEYEEYFMSELRQDYLKEEETEEEDEEEEETEGE